MMLNTKANLRGVLLALATLMLAALSPGAAHAEDPLPSWNEGAAKAAIISFVERVTTEGSADFVPVPERIAVFDNDEIGRAHV